jgi:hypothetical protein
MSNPSLLNPSPDSFTYVSIFFLVGMKPKGTHYSAYEGSEDSKQNTYKQQQQQTTTQQKEMLKLTQEKSPGPPGHQV